MSTAALGTAVVGFGQGEHQHEQFQDAEPDKAF